MRRREKSPSYPGFMTITEIQRRGPQSGNVDMANHHWAGNDDGYVWESHKSLITYHAPWTGQPKSAPQPVAKAGSRRRGPSQLLARALPRPPPAGASSAETTAAAFAVSSSEDDHQDDVGEEAILVESHEQSEAEDDGQIETKVDNAKARLVRVPLLRSHPHDWRDRSDRNSSLVAPSVDFSGSA